MRILVSQELHVVLIGTRSKGGGSSRAVGAADLGGVLSAIVLGGIDPLSGGGQPFTHY